MSDLISRQDAIDAIPQTSADAFENCRNCKLLDRGQVIDIIESLPSADRPTGEWINREKCQVDEDAYEVATCSECGAEITIEYPHDSYCPNCGAKMGGDSE